MSTLPADGDLPPRNPVIHNAAIAGAVLTPLVMLLPPRKLDIRFLILMGTFSLSTNQLAYAYTGQSIYNRLGSRASSIFGDGLPEGAKRTQQLLKEQRERQAAQKQADEKKAGLIKELWMGGETAGWHEKRAAEHQQAFEEGKGMSDLIMEQISDVFRGNWGNTSKSDESATTTTVPSEAKKETPKE